MRDVSLNLVDSSAEAERFLRWFGESRPLLGVDTETGGLEWWRQPLRMIQVGDHDTGWAIPVEGPRSWGGLIADVLREYRGPTVWQNLKFDAHFLQGDGYPCYLEAAHDTRIMGHLHDNDSPTGLKSMAVRYVDVSCGVADRELKAAMKANGWGWDTVPVAYDRYWQYAALDPVLTVRVAEELLPEVEARWAKPYDVELATQQVLIDMEQHGVQIDRTYCVQRLSQMRHRQTEVGDVVRTDHGVDNPNSQIQVVKALQDAGVKLTKRTEKGSVSLDKEVLDSIEHPLAALVKEWRHIDKIAGTYLENFLDWSGEDGILHPSMNLLGAKTSRMSVSKPSLQNLERSPDVRDAFIPREGNVLLLVDYDQIELRLLAHYAQEQSMLDAIHEGHDLHTEMCRLIYELEDGADVPRELRQLTKNGTYAKLYGAGVTKFAQTVGVTPKQAEIFLEAYDTRFPRVVAFQKIMQETGENRLDGEGMAYVNTWLGRRLRVHEQKIYRLVNYLIQGTAAEIFKMKLVELDLAGLSEYLVLPVHDEFVFDVPIDEVEEFSREVVRVATSENDFSVPLTVGTEVVKRWGDKYRDDKGEIVAGQLKAFGEAVLGDPMAHLTPEDLQRMKEAMTKEETG